MEQIYCDVCANRATVICRQCGYIVKTDGSISIPTMYCRTTGAMASDERVARHVAAIKDYVERGIPLPLSVVISYNGLLTRE